MNQNHPYPSDEIEIILPEESCLDLVRSVNSLTARYRKDYVLTDIYLCDNKGKLVFTKKREAA